MLFIYWGWDTAVSVNEETKERQDPGPGGDHLDLAAAGHLPDRDLRGGVVRRHRSQGDRPDQRGHSGDVLSVLGGAIFGGGGFGTSCPGC